MVDFAYRISGLTEFSQVRFLAAPIFLVTLGRLPIARCHFFRPPARLDRPLWGDIAQLENHDLVDILAGVADQGTPTIRQCGAAVHIGYF